MFYFKHKLHGIAVNLTIRMYKPIRQYIKLERECRFKPCFPSVTGCLYDT